MPPLAVLEVYHSRPAVPVRRVAIGIADLPVDHAPGYGGVLLGGVLSAHARRLDDDHHDDLAQLIDDVDAGRRVPQPRLRHRLEEARHGLARSTQRLWLGRSGRPDDVVFDLECNGSAIQQALAAVYAMQRLPATARHHTADVLRRALAWEGEVDAALVSHLGGRGRTAFGRQRRDHDPELWARDMLGMAPPNGHHLTRRDIQTSFRARLRDIHPDTGGDPGVASRLIEELADARRILEAAVERSRA